jgi:hypothetical protein
MKLFGLKTKKYHFALHAVMALALQAHTMLAENRLSLQQGSDHRITVHLSNTDRIAGLQFSIQASGIAIGAYIGTDRTASAALGIYQYLKDESTLNVIILAPVRSSLPAGEGAIGTISFSVKSPSADGTIQMSLNGVMICDADAKALDVTCAPLIWKSNDINDSQNKNFALDQNYPNPFNPSTTLEYRLDKPEHVRLAVYDMRGRQVRTLVDLNQTEGTYSVRWFANNGGGLMLPSGTYIAQLRVGDQTSIKKMIYSK